MGQDDSAEGRAPGPRGETVGVVGLGQMGLAMGTNLLRAGFDVAGFDVDGARVAALAQTGGTACRAPAEVSATAPVVITSLPSAEALRAVLEGPEGLLGARRGAQRSLVVVETSTLAIEDKESARRLALAAGATLLDCPLSGTAAQARARDVVVYASGDATVVERCAPIFEAFARSHHHVGPFGAGMKLKIVANLLVAIHNVAAAEAFVLATKAGLDRQTVYDLIADGAGTSRMFEVRGPLMVAGSYEPPAATFRLFQKDLGIIADFARSLDCPTPLLTASLPVYLAALAQGLGDQDTAAVCTVLERLAGEHRP